MDDVVSTRRQQTRDRLVQAAIEVFAQRSIEGASVEDICEQAGFTRGAFYSNFETKEDLCLQIVRRRGEQLLDTTQQALAMISDADTGPDALSQVISGVVSVLDVGLALDENWVLVRQELRLYAFRNPGFRPALAQAESEATALVATALAEALERHHAELLVPIPEVMLTLDAYCERARLDAILAGAAEKDEDWRGGLEKLVRSLVVFPTSA